MIGLWLLLLRIEDRQELRQPHILNYGLADILKDPV
jgi:hypothetical protein